VSVVFSVPRKILKHMQRHIGGTDNFGSRTRKKKRKKKKDNPERNGDRLNGQASTGYVPKPSTDVNHRGEQISGTHVPVEVPHSGRNICITCI
jgi:hypothetical protein